MMNYRVGRIEKAVGFWEQGRASSPDLIPPRLNLAFYYETTGNHSQAREFASEILRANRQYTVKGSGSVSKRVRHISYSGGVKSPSM